MLLIFPIFCFNFLIFYIRCAIVNDRLPLMGAFHNASGISFRSSIKRDKAYFVVLLKICGLYPTQLSIEQEPINFPFWVLAGVLDKSDIQKCFFQMMV